ncbi:sigma-70 family RNA polymerase sigma factor [Lactococcus lactis]|uniref:sigma-70 family RNA polymerase sigma factor n=1 Tax=Lactococcus lactis TaxID=1358 RepID=UPI000BA5FFD8|nr:sigma-70 family RNA polymerase sigma factor [Lactococcus lactis]PAK67803.1 hypothetical protein B8W94_03810 [Lactococcus lactis]PEN17735.1 sigma-70 family RNA polymerase sigma factor [Lactococcus lactis]TYR17214.1 sigma-70 family RNA polymerase sigma factor [Lactococcus lactis subsp. lactis bv. diacetylactis]
MIKYYWGKPEKVLRSYLLGILNKAQTMREEYIRKIGADLSSISRQRKLLENLDALFNNVNVDIIALLCLRYVEELSVAEITERTGLSSSQIYSRTSKVMNKAKKIMIQS